MKFEEIIPGLREGRCVTHHGETYELTDKGLVQEGTTYAVDLGPWVLLDDDWEFEDAYETPDDIHRKISDEPITLLQLKTKLLRIMKTPNMGICSSKLMDAQSELLRFINDNHISRIVSEINYRSL